MGKYSYVVFGCTCDKCGKELFDDDENIVSEKARKEAMYCYGWTEIKDGRVLCEVCYDEEIENEE